MKRISLMILLLLLTSCSMPRIVVFDDPLTAAQHNELGYIYESQGKYLLAEKEYRAAIKNQEGWSTPYFNLGNVYFKMRDLDKAQELFRAAIERDPSHSDAMNNLAYVLSEQGRGEDAKKWIGRALSINRKEEYLDTQRKIFSREKGSRE